MIENKSYEEYQAQVETKFELLNTEPPVELILISVSERRSHPGQEYFSLIFLGANDYLLPQQSYEMRHSVLGEGLMFLVPVSRDADGTRYEAVFNRLIKENLQTVKSGDQ